MLSNLLREKLALWKSLGYTEFNDIVIVYCVYTV